MTTRPLFVLLPGLGADRRLFAAQQEALPDLYVPPWMPIMPGERLSDYAARFASQIPVDRPLILGGCSFGGMVAREMACILRPAALVLIGSAGGPDDVPRHLRLLSLAAGALPTACFTGLRRASRPAARLFGPRTPAHRRLFAEMLRDMPSEFLRRACASIGRWRATPLDGVPVFTIHGRHDLILPPRRRRPIDVLLRDGGHMLTLTHPNAVNAFLLDVLRRVSPNA